MRFEIDFCDPDVDDWRTVIVTLSEREVAAAQAARDVDLYAMAYALRHAYREVPKGYRHVGAPAGIRRVLVN
jgi:hypothetical protein